jgi:hypothetical protein
MEGNGKIKRGIIPRIRKKQNPTIKQQRIPGKIIRKQFNPRKDP